MDGISSVFRGGKAAFPSRAAAPADPASWPSSLPAGTPSPPPHGAENAPAPRALVSQLVRVSPLPAETRAEGQAPRPWPHKS